MSISYAVYLLFKFYWVLILLRIFMTWIPNIDWNQQPMRWMREVTDAYLNIFRRFIPPIGMLDVSPIVALIVLGIVQTIVCEMLARIGL